MAEKANHLKLSALYDVVNGKTILEKQVREHLEACERCRTEIRWIQSIAELAGRELDYEPARRIVAAAENVFAPGRQPAETADEVVADLVYDSFTEPLPMGIRRQDLASRQAVYQTDHVQLDLKIELGDEKGLIVGQIFTETGNPGVRGLKIEIIQGGRLVGKSTTNALGEFIFQDLPRGDYELQVIVADTMVKLPPLQLTE
jgi:hypothetical protein